MRAAIGSQCKLINRGVTCILFSSLKINLAAAFWINCKGLIELAERPAKRALQYSSLDITRAGTRSCESCSERKGLIFLMFLCFCHGINKRVLWTAPTRTCDPLCAIVSLDRAECVCGAVVSVTARNQTSFFPQWKAYLHCLNRSLSPI